MKVLVIGRDLNLFVPESENYKRVKEYAELFTEYHVINMVGGKHLPMVDGKLFIWPTNSFLLLFAWFDAFRLGFGLAGKRSLKVVDAQDPAEAGLAAFLVAKFCHLPLRLQIHTDILNPYFRRASWKERIRYWLARFIIPRADHLRVVSERIKKTLIGLGIPGSRITVLPIFTDVSRFLKAARDPETDQRLQEYDFKMIAVGRFVDKEKNFSMLLKIMADLVKIHPKLLLVLMGDGPDRSFYEKEMQNLGLAKNVIIEGWRSDFPAFYKSFDLFLLSSNYEGWGRVVIEAMASGLPIVMTDVGLAGEIVKNKENGIIIEVGNARAFSKAIIEIAQNKEKKLLLATRALVTARSLNLPSRTEYLKKYREVLFCCKK